MLRTLALSPAICSAMLPQKFSAATTAKRAWECELPAGAGAERLHPAAARAAAATAAAAAARRVRAYRGCSLIDSTINEIESYLRLRRRAAALSFAVPGGRRLRDPRADPMDPDTLRNRREQRRREIRRRRAIAAVALVAALLAVAAVVATGSGGGSAGTAKSSAGHVAPGAASSTAAQPASTPAVAQRTAVPVLMYHVIAAPPAGAPFPGLYVPPEEFQQQMSALHDAGWHAVTQDQVLAHWRTGASLGSGKPIVLTFDNGYHSQYAQALPVLRRLGWVGVENIQLSGLPPSQGGLSQSEVEGLVAAGWELDTQGYDHADLITLDAQQLAFQVAETRKVIQARYHVPVNWFCYPSGHYDETVISEVRSAGYQGSTTVVPGWARAGEDPYRMHRLRVLGGTSGAQLLELIAGTRTNPPAPASYSGA